MIELPENLLEITILSICLVISLMRAQRDPKRSRILLSLFYAGFFLGNLYWTLYLIFYDRTPAVFYVSELSWLASYLFLVLLLRHYQTDAERRVNHPVLWLIGAFVFGMMLFYFRWGDYLLNVSDAILMGLLMIRSAQGLLALRGRADERKKLYGVTMAFCLIEYALWTASCFWVGDTVRNPYFWIGVIQMSCFPFFIRAVGKAEAA